MRRFGLIGKTLKHSFSKTYFEKKFEEQGITDCSYDNFELKSIDEFSLFSDLTEKFIIDLLGIFFIEKQMKSISPQAYTH